MDRQYMVIITAVLGETAKDLIADALTKVIKGADRERIRTRLDRMPWTVTEHASEKNAAALKAMLEKRGATVEINPLLPAPETPLREPAPVPKRPEPTQPGARGGAQTPGHGGTESPYGAPQAQPITPDSHRQGYSIGPAPAPPAIQFQSGEYKPLPPRGGAAGTAEVWDFAPLTIGETLDKAFRIGLANFWHFLAIMAATGAPQAVIFLLLILVGGPAVVAGADMGSINYLWLVLLFVPGLIIHMGLYYLQQAAMIYSASNIFLGKKNTAKEAYMFAFGKLGRLAAAGAIASAAMVVYGLVIALVFYAATWLGLLVLLVSIPYFVMLSIRMLDMVDKIIVLEDMGVIDSFGRSRQLVSGRDDSVWPKKYMYRLGLLGFIFIVLMIAGSFALEMAALPIQSLLKDTALSGLGTVIGHLFNELALLIIGLFYSVGMVIFYYDIRIRKEGFDLEMLAKRL